MARSDEHPIDAETRGWAIVGQNLSFALLGLLEKRGLITPNDREFVLETVLSGLERIQMQHPADPAMQVAREALQAMINTRPTPHS